MIKKLIKLVFSSTILSGMIFVIFVCCIVSTLQEEDEDEAVYVEAASSSYPRSVEAYREIVYKACNTYHNEPFSKTCGKLTDYVELALAIMTEESHGSGTDPMQSSECGFNTLYPRVPNGITDPVYSIECGVQYMRNALITAKVTSPTDFDRIGVAVQGYNFGVDKWCRWISKRGGKYTVALATQYQKEVMKGAGTPTHAQKVLNTYKAALAGNDKGKKVDTDVNINNIPTILNLNTTEAWQLTCGKGITSHPTTSNLMEVAMKRRITTIEVPVWDFASSKGTKKHSVSKKLSINTNLAPFWKAFFKEVYEHPDKIVIHELAGYCYRTKRGSSSLSAHAFGTAVDINWTTAGNGWQVTPYSKKQWKKLKGREKELTIYQGCPLVKIAQKYTLSWGGSWTSVKDPMHFSYIGDTPRG